MTRQRLDLVHIGRKSHVLAGSTHRLFDPAAHGIRVAPLTPSSCWRGFACEYRLGDDGRLSLTHLMVYVEKPEHAVPLASCHAQLAPVDFPQGEHVYEGLDLPLPPFDGSIILGEWLFHELIFLDGRLVRRRRRWSMSVPAELSTI